MFCPNCGVELPGGVLYCKECGARITASLEVAPQHAAPVQARDDAQRQTPANQARPLAMPVKSEPDAPASSAKSPRQADGEKTSSKKARAILVVAIVAVALIAAGIGGFMFWRTQQDAAAEAAASQAAYEAAHTRHAVVFKVDAAGYSDATASKIPVHVTGSDADGASVNEDAFVNAEGQGLELARGVYVVSVVVSPLCSDGTVYDVSADTWNITVGEDVTEGENVDATSRPMVLAPIEDVTALTDEQIAQIHDYAVKGGMDQSTADQYRDATTSKRQAAIDQKAAEAAAAEAAAQAQREAEAEAARKAQYHVSNDYFEFDIPACWYDRVSTKKGYLNADAYEDITVYDTDTGEDLVSFEVCDASNEIMSGDISGVNIESVTIGGGKRLKVIASNYPYLIWYSHHNGKSSKWSTDQEERLVDLSTGGALSRDDVVASDGNSLAKTEQSFYNEQIVPTIVTK